MVSVKTFICAAGRDVPVEEFAGPVEHDASGVIELIANHVPILTKDLHGDTLDFLWTEMLSATLEIVGGRKAAYSMLESQTQLSFEPIRAGRDVLITVDPAQPTQGRACADLRELSHNIVTAGRIYCKHMTSLVAHRCVREVGLLDQIEEEFRRRAT